ncbi:hypothetical protein [Bradyrhizobium sp. CW10]|uniref:hypothetical protein n=1 Tax=Bradyrhizobium sp. CW10 TaxID=2782683 RepID=UPI001FFB9851|nr:hypothetical protein [Bradyrhizobium sp. CW10]MCK1471216.1 hypothetical protein [Bradyrhizobium sp. CW10]
MPTFDEEVHELETKMHRPEAKRPKFPDQAKKIIYLFRNHDSHLVANRVEREIRSQAELGSVLGLGTVRWNKMYWGVEKIQPSQIDKLAEIYKFNPKLFKLPADEFILSVGGYSIKWDQAIELAEAVKDPVQIVGIKDEIRKQKQLRLSVYPNKQFDDIQTVQANAPFQWKLSCKSLFPNGIIGTEISARQVFAFEYDSRTELVQTATLLPEHKIADAEQFFKKEDNELWWIFPEPTAKVFPRFPEDDVNKTIDLVLFVFKDGAVEDDLRNGILSTIPLKVSDPIVRRFSSKFHVARGEKRAAAVRSRVRVVSQ